MNDIGVINLSRGKFTVVDAEVFCHLNKYHWQNLGGRTPYVYREIENRKKLLLHREICKATGEQEVDHRNGFTFDNTSRNLRIATNKENARNRRKIKGTVSRFKGVTWHRANKLWTATIFLNGKNKTIGSFRDEESAARAYDEAVKRHFGEFAVLNF